MLDHLAPEDQYDNSAYDWHSAPWLSLLRVPEQAVALHVGADSGGIAEALSQMVTEVFAVDLDPARVAFGKLRLDQQGVGNVRVVQASGADLPFHDGTFDLIVVTGPLEWIGADHRGTSARGVERAAYAKLHQLLRPGGTMVVGVDNRFGNQFFRGEVGRSGVRYAGLMPRWAANALAGGPAAHVPSEARITHAPLHSRRALSSLLHDSGFRDIDFFWADPDYEQPYHLIPLQGALPGLHIHAKLNEPSQSVRRGWKRKLKAMFALSGMVRNFVGSFIVFSHRPVAESDVPLRHGLWKELRSGMPALPELSDPIFALFTHARSSKSLLRVYDARRATLHAMLKATTTAPGSLESVNAEYDALLKAAEPLAALDAPPFTVPRPMGRHRIGKVVYTAEMAIPGAPLAYLMFSPTAEVRIELVRRHLLRVVDASAAISGMLRDLEFIPMAGRDWYDVPEEFRGIESIARIAEIARREQTSAEGAPAWSHHGDLTVENVFDVAGSGQVAVIDWADMVRGTPALYDVFTALLSTLPAVGAEGGDPEGSVAAWTGWLRTAFFDKGPWAELYGEMLRRACEKLGVGEDRVWPQFCQFLLARTHYFAERGSGVRSHQMEFLALAAEISADFVLPG